MKPPKQFGHAGKGLSKITHNPKALAGAAGVVVLLALFAKRNANGAAAGGTTAGGTSSTTATGQINPSQGGYYDSTANDVYGSLAGQIQALQSQITASSSGASTPTPAPNPAPVTKPVAAPPTLVHAPAPRPTARPKTPPRPAPAPQTPSYVVRPGDTLGGIAAHYGIRDWRSLYQANVKVVGPNPNLIKPGQRLSLAGLLGR